MDGFTDNFVSDNAEADFLARERDQLAGLEDEIAPPNAPVNDIGTVTDDSELAFDTIGGMILQNGINNGENDINQFDQPDVEELGAENELKEDSKPTYSISPITVREEPEKIRIWREAQSIILDEKDEKESTAKTELHEKAKKELEEWYSQHEDQVAKTRQANRSAEKELVADTSKLEPGTEWERIAKLCDFNPKSAKSTRDISRMRSIILQVKQNPPLKSTS